MTVPARADIEAAATRIAGHVRHTPVLALPRGTGGIDARLTLKLDLLQPTGSFKVRGAFSRLLAEPTLPERVVAASGGNFGMAVAYAADRLGMAADVFVPATSPPAKIERLRDYGAVVHVIDGYYADALIASEEFTTAQGGMFAHAYDQIDVVAGQGTCGLEMSRQAPDADAVMVAVGGGGLIAGIASWYRGDTRVIGVETEGTPTLYEARRQGGPVDVDVGGIAVSSLGSRRLGSIAWEATAQFVDRALLVDDRSTAEAQRWLWRHCRLAVEPGAATPIAALLSGAFVPPDGAHVLVLVCGANVDPATVVG